MAGSRTQEDLVNLPRSAVPITVSLEFADRRLSFPLGSEVRSMLVTPKTERCGEKFSPVPRTRKEWCDSVPLADTSVTDS